MIKERKDDSQRLAEEEESIKIILIQFSVILKIGIIDPNLIESFFSLYI